MDAIARPENVDFATEISGVRGALQALVKRAVPVVDRVSARVHADLPLLEGALRTLDPTLSLRHVRARVVDIRDETHDVKTFVLRPNARFGAYRPGSFVTLHVRIAGKPVQRSYSLSSTPSGDGLIAITVKRVEGGLVSNWLADTLRRGDVLALSAPQGQFVLPEEVPETLLLISAGSGITPVMSMLRKLTSDGVPSQISFVHFARSPRDVIFADELSLIAQRHPNVRVTVCVEQADDAWTGPRGRFSEALISEVAPEFRSTETYLCGPSGFMKVVMQTLEHCEADLAKLRYERFNTDFDASQFLEHSQVLRFVRTGSESISNKPRTILEEAEGLGVRVESGCRVGNCGSCRCTKTKGVVVDIITGRESGAGEEFIYPCISIAKGTVEVDL